MIKSPRLVDAQMHETERLHPSTLQLTLKFSPPSSAVMTLTNEEAEVDVGAMVRIESPQGDSMLFVVRSVATDYVTGIRTVNLEDAFTLLNDTVAFEEVTPEVITGVRDATKSTVTQAVTKLLSYQTTRRWTLGECDYTDEQGWAYTNSTIYNALTNLFASLEDCWITYDTTVMPWKLNIKRAPSDVACEMRAARNLASMSMTMDRSGMCTRIYPTGASGLTIEGVNSNVAYLERGVDVWGVVSRVESDSSIEDANLLKAWGQRMLKRLCEPLVTVNIDGLELSEATGEPLDRLRVGTLCRVPLPSYKTTVTERITQIAWRDMIHEPEHVQVTLANNPRTVQGVLHKIQKKTGGGGSAGTTDNAEKSIYTVFEKDDEHITLMAVAKRRMQTAWSRINITADKIDSIVQKYNYNDAGDLLESYYSQITQNADKIKLAVTRGDLIAAIEVEAGKVKISANAIDLTGYTTMTAFNARTGSAGVMNIQQIYLTSICRIMAGGTLSVSGNMLFHGYSVGMHNVTSADGTTWTCLTVGSSKATEPEPPEVT